MARKIEENLAKKSEAGSMASTKMSVYNGGPSKNSSFYKTTNVFVKNSLKKQYTTDVLTPANLDAFDN